MTANRMRVFMLTGGNDGRDYQHLDDVVKYNTETDTWEDAGYMWVGTYFTIILFFFQTMISILIILISHD